MVGLAIPLTRKSARRNMRVNRNYDFVSQITWPIYQIDTIKCFKTLEPVTRSLKVAIIKEFEYSDWCSFFQQQKYKALILFAHWVIDSVELFDGFHKAEDFLNAFPVSAKCIVDLNVCNCTDLGLTLGVNRPNSIVKHAGADIESYPGAWFLFYSYFFTLLSGGKYSYGQALDLTKSQYKNIFL